MQPINKMRTEFLSKSANESFARVVAASFAAQADPSIEVVADIRTAVSEAVTTPHPRLWRGGRNSGSHLRFVSGFC